MTHEEKQLEVIRRIVAPLWVFFEISKDHQVDWYCKKILTALRELETERLEVEITVNPSGEGGYGLEFPCMFEEDFSTRQEAIDFIKKYGLKLKE
jgi:hypothetical protein